MRLPDLAHVVMTGPTDPIRYHYQPVIRYFMNCRLAMALTLLAGRRFKRLLDAGFGGGVFLLELARHAEELHGIDIHDHVDEVRRMVALAGTSVRLRRASIVATGYPDAFFDGVVSISVLEFVDDLRGALAEIRRIVAPGGTIILGFPGENLWTRLGYLVARTPDPREVHRANYRMILAEAERELRPVRLLRFPAFLPPRSTLYFVAEFERP